MNWVKQSNESSELNLDKSLVLLLRSTHFYKHILSQCANIDYLQQLLHIYYNTQSSITQLLSIRFLRYLIPSISNDKEGISKNLIEKFLSDIANSIGEQNLSKEILSELIFLYRTIISMESPWQIFAKEFVLNSIKSHLNLQSIENNHLNPINQLLASLSILGGFIETIRLGSLVKIQTNDDFELALVTEINQKDRLYTIQHLGTNQIQSVTMDKLQLEIDVLPPNLLESNEIILDLLGNFLQIDSSNSNSLLFFELQRRSVSVLLYLLNDKESIELFMSKPYASILAKLSKTNLSPSDLRVFNKQHLEQYFLSLTKYPLIENKNSSQSILINKENNVPNWNKKKINANPLVLQSLSTSMNGWRPYVSEDEIQIFKQGIKGNEEISIVSHQKDVSKPEAIQQCGNKHKYNGRIVPNNENTSHTFPTYIIDNLQLSEGKWYYCVRLPYAGRAQIGWGANYFSTSSEQGVGNDSYSWGYDGSRSVLCYYNTKYRDPFDGEITWKENDIIGCGIDINNVNTNIKYWLNGQFLGTAFEHMKVIRNSDMTCNLSPNGSETSYYPAISLNFKNTPKIAAELILSPEDMDGCPLPHGYKPLLLPKVIPIENTIVEYPSHAYLIGENSQEEFLIQKQTKSTKNILRDFVNDKHLETSFNIENNSLNLPANSDGLSLSLANADTSSVTISFDYQILSDNDNKSEFILAKFDSIEIPWKKPNQTQQCIVLVLSKNGPIKVYTNNQCQTYDHKFQNAKIHLLPGIASQIKNLALWNYSLDEEQLSRLFTYGLCYISNDYQQMKEYRKRVNKITFTKNQQQFEKEYLLPFNQPFTETLWEQKKKQIDEDESKYFKSHDDEDYSTIDLYGSKTYLVLNKSNEIWTNYTFILEILIPQWPLENEKLTLLTLNSNIELYIAYDGQLCLDMDNSKKTSDIPIYLNEYLRLFVISDNQTLHVYVNDELRLNIENPQNRFQITTNHIDLFKQTQNSTNDDTLLLSLKSFSYLNRSIPVEEVLSTTSTAPPFEIIAPSLIAMGYKKHWIEPLLNGNQLKAIATSLHEQKEQLIKSDFDNQVQEYLKRLRKVNSAINADTIKDFMDYSKFHTNEQLMDTVQRVYTYLLSSQSSSELNQVKLESDESWFSQKVEDLSIPLVVTDWLESIKPNPQDSNNNQLFDMEAVIKKKKAESTEYSHDNLSSQQLYQSRLYCEQGLITIYAREIIRNMFKIWTTYDETILFPLEKFNDYSILKLLDIIKLDQISLIIKPILQNECQLNQTKPLFDYLQKDAMTELIEIFLKPSRFKQLNTKFILNVLNNFLELFKHNPNSIDSIFSVSLIRLLFNLFLFIPSFDIKVSILYLFNNILRINDQYSLPNDIQSFFVNLLVQTVKYSDATRKKFQLALTDLVYLVLKKDHDQLKQYQAKLPSNILNLYLLADIITIWISPDKEKILPEKFFQESKFIVETSYTLNQNNYQKTNEYFSINSDKELMNYLNQCLVNDQSFPHILEGMSKESQPDPIFYKNYILLSNIPADCVEIRAKFIYLLSSFVGNLISLLDLSLQPEQSFLTDQIRRIKLYLLSSAKLQLFNTSLDDTRSYEYGSVSVNFDTVTASTDINKPEYTMFYQAYQQLHSTAHELFRRADDQLWQAQYIGMHSTDAGGPYRDSITRIGSDICSTRLPLFILCPNGRTNSGLNRDCWIPNIFPPNKSIPLKYQKQYRFVGQLIGMAIRKKHYLNIKFPNFLWKRLLNEEITSEDIESIDIQSFTMINELEKNIEQIHSFDNNEQDIDSVFSSVMGELHFDVVSSSEQVYELVPGGKDISITPKNFKHYCSLYRQYRLNEFNRQITLIQQGLYSIVPAYALNLFTSNELEESVCGKDRIDIEILKRNTEYGDSYNQTSPVIERFWTVMNDMFTDEQKKLFLIFVWGRSTLPTRDEDFRQKLKINPFLVYEGENVDRTLPRSHTCFFTLDLPAYSTTDIMYERLNYALATCSSIDGDGTMRDEANFVPHDSDDD